MKLQVLHRRRKIIKNKNILLKSVAYRPNYVWKYNSQNISCRKTKRKVIMMKEMESSFETLRSRAWLAHVLERSTGAEEVEGSSSRPGQHSGS